MSYRPLQNSLTIKPSPMDGLGLFAREYIRAGTLLGTTHYDIKDVGIIRTPLGGFINHSDTPNSELHIDNLDGQDYYRLVTLKGISRGDEITIKYQHFNTFRPNGSIV